MEVCPDLSFDSYDRFFPIQDTLPKGGLGNLIALPLHYQPRQQGGSVYVEAEYMPSRVSGNTSARLYKVSPEKVAELVGSDERWSNTISATG